MTDGGAREDAWSTYPVSGLQTLSWEGRGVGNSKFRLRSGYRSRQEKLNKVPCLPPFLAVNSTSVGKKIT